MQSQARRGRPERVRVAVLAELGTPDGCRHDLLEHWMHEVWLRVWLERVDDVVEELEMARKATPLRGCRAGWLANGESGPPRRYDGQVRR
jgi:hypothetical protein